MNKIIWPPQLPIDDGSHEASASPSLAVRQAVIMAGGKGTRLHPYSAIFPKPLMPLGDMPIMELLLRRLKAAGIVEVIVAVNHQMESNFTNPHIDLQGLR